MLDLIFFSDETNCYLSVHVNKENMQFWAEAQPHEYAECPLSQKKGDFMVCHREARDHRVMLYRRWEWETSDSGH